MPSETDVDMVRRLSQADHGLAMIVVQREDGSPSCSVVNAGVVRHPVTDEFVTAFVSRGDARRLRYLRRRARATALFRWGWQWVAVEGATTLAGPEDELAGLRTPIPQLLRDIFVAAGGTHENWNEYDRVMQEEGRTAVFVELEKVYSNR